MKKTLFLVALLLIAVGCAGTRSVHIPNPPEIQDMVTGQLYLASEDEVYFHPYPNTDVCMGYNQWGQPVVRITRSDKGHLPMTMFRPPPDVTLIGCWSIESDGSRTSIPPATSGMCPVMDPINGLIECPQPDTSEGPRVLIQ